MPLLCSPGFFHSHLWILRPCLSTAGFVRAVVPGTEGPPPGSPNVSLLAHFSGRQPAVAGEVQGGRWVRSSNFKVVAPVFLFFFLRRRGRRRSGMAGSTFCLWNLEAVFHVCSAPFRTLGIDEPLPLKKRKITKPGFTHSPWKSAYIRQHRIDTNWRRGDLKSPKVFLFFLFSLRSQIRGEGCSIKLWS